MICCEIPEAITDTHLISECRRMKKVYQKVVISCWFKAMVQLHSVLASLQTELDQVGILLGVFFKFVRSQRQNTKNEPSPGRCATRSEVITQNGRPISHTTSRNEVHEQMYLSIAFQCRCVTECARSVHRIISGRLRFRENLQLYKLAAPLAFLSVIEKKKSDRRCQRPVPHTKETIL